MAKRTQDEQTMFDAIGLLAKTFTAATTDIVTSNAHGFKTGDRVVLTTSGTLPAGLATSTVYRVIKIDANTFYLTLKNSDSVTDRVDITDTGTGTHTATMYKVSNVIRNNMYQHSIFSFNTANSANMTVKFVGSSSDTCPDFNAAQSVSNRYDYIDVIDLQNGASIDGDTGIAPAGTDDHRIFEANVNHLRWIAAVITAYTAGDVTIKGKLTDNK